jgi:hypothetical protein
LQRCVRKAMSISFGTNMFHRTRSASSDFMCVHA